MITGAPRILVPLAVEAIPIRRGAPSASIERIGMGPRHAEATTRRLLACVTLAVPMVLIGVAGGLEDGGHPGDVVVASKLGLVDGGDEIVLPEARGVADLLDRASIRARLGVIVSSPAIIHGAANRRHAGRNGALAVDMESYWCAPLARQHPFAVVRVLLDVPGRELRSTAVISSTREAYRSLRRVARTLAQWSPVSVDRYPFPEVGES